jgi:hypothetical protein
MEPIVYEKTVLFVPDATQIRILQTVAGKTGCHINHVVHELQGEAPESRVRSAVRQLLQKQFLNGGNTFDQAITLQLTSKGRLSLQNAEAK